MRKGKLNHYSKKQIMKIEPSYVFDENNVAELCDLLEMDMMRDGFVLYDDMPLEFEEEVIVNGYHELRYSCAVFVGHRRKGEFVLTEARIQYRHIK